MTKTTANNILFVIRREICRTEGDAPGEDFKPMETTRREGRPAGGPDTLLIVDDDLFNRSSLE